MQETAGWAPGVMAEQGHGWGGVQRVYVALWGRSVLCVQSLLFVRLPGVSEVSLAQRPTVEATQPIVFFR